jgi:lipid-A-disaccharide synthase-like uncharacterized protein
MCSLPTSDVIVVYGFLNLDGCRGITLFGAIYLVCYVAVVTWQQHILPNTFTPLTSNEQLQRGRRVRGCG